MLRYWYKRRGEEGREREKRKAAMSVHGVRMVEIRDIGRKRDGTRREEKRECYS